MRRQSKHHEGSQRSEWTTVGKQGARPTPRQATLGDFIVGNRFSAFDDEDYNDMATTTTCSNTAKHTIKGDICTDFTKLLSDFPNSTNSSMTGLPIGPQLTGTAKGEGSNRVKIEETGIYNTNFPPLTARSSGTTTTTTTTTIPIRTTTTHIWPASKVENDYESILDDLFGSSDAIAVEGSGGADIGCDEGAEDPDEPDLEHQNCANVIAPIEYMEDDAVDEINNADEELEVYVTMDSGAITHIGPREAMPRGAELKADENGVTRNFVAANGIEITNHGRTIVEMETPEGQAITCPFQVADVTRPLHSTGQICDAQKEILHTARGAVVVPAGALSRHLRGTKIIAKYPRRNGLHMGRFKVRNPKGGNEDRKPGFTRQGAKR